MANENQNMDSGIPQSSYMQDDLPADGLAEDELELARKRLIDERRDGFRKYAEDRLTKDSDGFK